MYERTKAERGSEEKEKGGSKADAEKVLTRARCPTAGERAGHL